MSNYSLVAANGLVEEFLHGSGEGGLELSPRRAQPEDLARTSLEIQHAGLKGLAVVHQTLEDHTLEHRRQMSDMMGISAAGFEATLDALSRTTAAVERNSAVTAAGFQATVRAIQEAGQHVVDSVEALRSDFNFTMGEMLTLQQHARAAQDQILQSVQAPLETAARELRERGERSYANGWYLEAYEDLLAAVEKNRFDYLAQRDLGNLFLYHAEELEIVEEPLQKAASHFAAAARYAEPYNVSYAAECWLYESAALALQRKWDRASKSCDRAIALNQNLAEAYYQRASLSALAGDAAGAARDLKSVLEQDVRYWDRAAGDGDFLVHPEVAYAVAGLLKEALEQCRVRYEAAAAELADLAPSPGLEQTLEAQELAALQQEMLPPDLASLHPYVEYVERSQALLQVACEFTCVYRLGGHGTGLDSGVAQVRFSAGGAMMASIGWDNVVNLWDVDAGKPAGSFRFGPRPIGDQKRLDAVTVQGDHVCVYSAWEQKVAAWNLESGEPAPVPDLKAEHPAGERRRSCTAAFSLDGRLLAVAMPDHTVAVWDTESGECVHALQGHANQVYALTFSPDGRLLASEDGLTRSVGGDAAYAIRVWDLEDGCCRHTFGGIGGRAHGLAFSPDGAVLASSGVDGDVRLWNLADGEWLRTISTPHTEIRSVAFSPDGCTLAAAGRDGLALADPAAGEVLQDIAAHTGPVYSVAYSPDGQTLASAGADNTIKIYRRKLQTRPAGQ